jgi:hypothetical protein
MNKLIAIHESMQTIYDEAQASVAAQEIKEGTTDDAFRYLEELRKAMIETDGWIQIVNDDDLWVVRIMGLLDEIAVPEGNKDIRLAIRNLFLWLDEHQLRAEIVSGALTLISREDEELDALLDELPDKPE